MAGDDVIAEILAKLPVKSLMRFNCVCKTWYSVISYPQFSNNLHRMRPCFLICGNPVKFSTITIESLRAAPTPLSLPWEREPDDYYSTNLFLGSCNGLVCVDLKSKSSPYRSGLILWNPSTRKFRRLPRPACHSFHYNLSIYAWFGYDELIDDYKLVWLNCSDSCRSPIETELHVFTLRSNTWRRPPVDHIALRVRGINNFYNFFTGRDGLSPKSTAVLSNGAIHWITRYLPPSGGMDECILALDLATEKFRLLKFSHAPLGLTVLVGSLLGGCLCLCSYAYKDPCYVRDLWMMKEYGVESSWTKVLSIPLPGEKFLRYDPILLSKDGKEIVACELSGRTVKLSVEGAKKVRFEETVLCVPRYIYQDIAVLHMEESLVSLFAD